MTDDPVILVCAAATFIAFATVFYIFLDEVRRYRALRKLSDQSSCDDAFPWGDVVELPDHAKRNNP